MSYSEFHDLKNLLRDIKEYHNLGFGDQKVIDVVANCISTWNEGDWNAYYIKPDYVSQQDVLVKDVVILPSYSPVYVGHKMIVRNDTINFGNSLLQNIFDPIAPQDCATKNYVDVAISNASNSTGQIENQFINQLNSEIARAQASENELKTYVDTTFSTIVNNNQSHQQIIDNLNAEIARARASEVSLLAKIDALYQFFLNTTSETAPTR
jgi:flagellar biosynthesis chaperone FliJ